MGIDPLYLWIGIGFALVIAEVTMGNFILFFLGLASICVGGAIWLGMPADGGLPFLLLAGLSVFFLFGVRSRMPSFTVGDIAESTEDEDFIGRNVTVESGFDEASPRRGRVNYRGVSWDAQSSNPHISVSKLIIITDRSGNNLIVDNEEV